MGVRQQLTELYNLPGGKSFEVWEEADGTITSKLGDAIVPPAFTNTTTGWVEVTGATLLGNRTPTIEYAYNIRPALTKIAAAVVTQCSVGFYGHSIVAGVGSDDTTGTTDEVNWATTAFPVAFSRALNAQLGTTREKGITWVGPDQQSLWTLGGGAAFDANAFQGSGIGGYRLVLSAAAHTAQISVTGTDITVYLLGTQAGVVARYAVDGGAVTSATAAPNDPTGFGTGVYYSFTITGLSNAAHTLQLVGPTANGVTVIGVEGRTQTANGVVVHRGGLQSMCLTDIIGIASDNTDATGPGNWITAGNELRRIAQSHSITDKLGAPSMLILMTDVNDLLRGYQTYSYSLADVRRHIQNVVTFCASISLPVLFVTGPWRKVSTYPAGMPYNQDDVVAQYRAVCAGSTTAALCDLRIPKYAAQGFDNAAGAIVIDHVHYNKVNAQVAGVALAKAVIGAIGF